MLKPVQEVEQDRAEELEMFVAHARQRDIDFETIRHMLLSKGWKEKEIAGVIAANELDLPIPAARRKGGAREAFFHLTAFTCMYVAAISLVIMLFQMVNLAFPDAVESYWQAQSAHTAIRSSVSTLLVFAPLYVVFSLLIRRDRQRRVITPGSTIERWLTYLTLFVIVMTVLIDASTLIYLLLGGEMTARVLVKGCILLAVVGSAFAYLWMGTYQWSTKASSADQAASG